MPFEETQPGPWSEDFSSHLPAPASLAAIGVAIVLSPCRRPGQTICEQVGEADARSGWVRSARALDRQRGESQASPLGADVIDTLAVGAAARFRVARVSRCGSFASVATWPRRIRSTCRWLTLSTAALGRSSTAPCSLPRWFACTTWARCSCIWATAYSSFLCVAWSTCRRDGALACATAHSFWAGAARLGGGEPADAQRQVAARRRNKN